MCVVFSVCYVIFTNYYLANISDTRLFLVFIILVSFARVIFLIVFTSFALNYWNRPHQLSHALSANSYDIYLVHIPIVLIFQLLLTELTDVSSFIKFGIVLFFSFALSYAIGKYITNRSPLLSVFCLFMIFVLMVIFL
ncbi:MAG: glucans biosynthesis protein [Deltaproteobacteria bacterium ADurb.BinA014]|nr:MAG: glucans biosynthesis protein [Deltaproteobacteria bacterium ADurb.BinA014]